MKNNRTHLLNYFKHCASFRSLMWIQTGVTVLKHLIWVLTSVTLTFDFWPRPLAWTSLLSMVITPENSMMIRGQEHSEKVVTDRRIDKRTERSVLRAAWLQLKIRSNKSEFYFHYFLGNITVHIKGKYQKDRMKTEGAYSIWTRQIWGIWQLRPA